jgi:hypothetical protein
MHKNCVFLLKIKSYAFCDSCPWIRVFEDRVLRKIFEPKRDELTGEWRRLHIEELYGLYS